MLLLDEATGSQCPWGPLRRGELGWRQRRVAAGQQNCGLAGLTLVVEEHHTELRCSHSCVNTMDVTDTANLFPATVQGGPAS